jgi:16S rRNA C967 or C1407 C5-methylase (RsmB/RsmF family)
VQPGGHLVYAVCSPEPEECESHVASMRVHAPDLELLKRWSSVPPVDGEDAHQALIWRRSIK